MEAAEQDPIPSGWALGVVLLTAALCYLHGIQGGNWMPAWEPGAEVQKPEDVETWLLKSMGMDEATKGEQHIREREEGPGQRTLGVK